MKTPCIISTNHNSFTKYSKIAISIELNIQWILKYVFQRAMWIFWCLEGSLFKFETLLFKNGSEKLLFADLILYQ